jgi:hypothetical protein
MADGAEAAHDALARGGASEERGAEAGTGGASHAASVSASVAAAAVARLRAERGVTLGVLRARLDVLEAENGRLRAQLAAVMGAGGAAAVAAAARAGRARAASAPSSSSSVCSAGVILGGAARVQSCVPLLQFVADSPYVQRTAEESMERVRVLSEQLERIGGAAHKWSRRSLKLVAAERALCGELRAAACSSASSGEVDLFETAAAQLSELVQSVADSREASVAGLERTLLAGVEAFESGELCQSREAYRAMNKARAEHDAALQSFLSSKRPGKLKSLTSQNQFLLALAQRESDAIVALEQYELGRLDLTRQLNLVEVRRQSALAEAVARGLDALHDGVRRDHDALERLRPRSEGLHGALPAVFTLQQDTMDHFGALRSELSRTLSRSVKLQARRAPGEAPGAGAGAGITGITGGAAADEADENGAGQEDQVVQTLSHRRQPSKGAAFVRRLAVRTTERLSSAVAASAQQLQQLQQLNSPKQVHRDGAGSQSQSQSQSGPASSAGGDEASAPSARHGHSRSGSIGGDTGRLCTAASFLLLKQSPPVREVLRGKSTLAAFLHFAAVDAVATAHVAFWLEVERFKALEEPRARAARAHAILDRYVCAEASQLLLSGGRKLQLAQALHDTPGAPAPLSRALFDVAQGEVQDILAAEFYTVFLRSDEWAACQAQQRVTGGAGNGVGSGSGSGGGSSSSNNNSNNNALESDGSSDEGPVERRRRQDDEYSPDNLAAVLPREHLAALRLISSGGGASSTSGTTTSGGPAYSSDVDIDKADECAEAGARSIVDSNSRVIMHGRFDRDNLEAFMIDYTASKALGLLDKDLGVIYAAAATRHAALLRHPGAGSGVRASSGISTSTRASRAPCDASATSSPATSPCADVPDGPAAGAGAGLDADADASPSTAETVAVANKAARLLGLQSASDEANVEPQYSQQHTPIHNNNNKASSARSAAGAVKNRVRTWASRRFSLQGAFSPAAGEATTSSPTSAGHKQAGREEQGEGEELDEEALESEDDGGLKAGSGKQALLLSLPSLLTPMQLLAPGGEAGQAIVKQGYLRRRYLVMHRKTWKRQWFVLRENRLYCVRDVQAGARSVELICECMLATVRECDASAVGVRPFSFELLSPMSKHSCMLQAENAETMRAWIDALRRCTEHMINGLTAASTTSSSGATASAASGGDAGARQAVPEYSCGEEEAEEPMPSEPAPGELGQLSADPVLRAAQLRNRRCADCSQPQPDWAVLNLGVLVCIECSGIHRSLGTHISKVRSLTLDAWTPAGRALLEGVGNASANAVWESDIAAMPGWSKPTHGAPRTVKERFIKAKYMWKGFLSAVPVPERHPRHDGTAARGVLAHHLHHGQPWCSCGEMPEALLLGAVSRNDAAQVMWYVVRGALETRAPASGHGPQTTPLHAAAQGAGLAVCEILLQNGAKPLLKVLDHQGHTPLELALAPDVHSLLSSCCA